jgi:hypothetical protein
LGIRQVGKAPDFDSGIRWFESIIPSQRSVAQWKSAGLRNQASGVRISPDRPNNKENDMKPVFFKNRMNNERFVCEDVRAVDVIDGVEYLVVHRPNEQRMFKMRRDALEKVNGVASVMDARLSVKQ